MARGGPDGSRHRGGESIQAPRPGHARVATGAVTLLAGAGLAVYPVAQSLDLHSLVVGLAALGLASLGLGLVTRWSSVLGAGLLALLGEYAVLFSAEGVDLDRYTPVYAVGFLFVAEMAFWSIERRVPAWSDDWLLEWRLGRLAGVCLGAALVAGFAMVNAAAATGGGGVALESAGVVAAIGSIVLLALLMRRMLLR